MHADSGNVIEIFINLTKLEKFKLLTILSKNAFSLLECGFYTEHSSIQVDLNDVFEIFQNLFNLRKLSFSDFYLMCIFSIAI